MSVAGKIITCRVHRLVAATFIGVCPAGYDVRHMDGNPANNTADNLRYGTRKENYADSVRHGTYTHGERHARAKLTDAKVLEILRLFVTGETTSAAALGRMFGVTGSTIHIILNGTSWKHIPRNGPPPSIVQGAP